MSALKNQILMNEIKKQNQVQQFLKEISSKVGQQTGHNNLNESWTKSYQ
jgi:hypothetical protein